MPGVLMSMLGIGRNIVKAVWAGVAWIFERWYRVAIAILLLLCAWLAIQLGHTRTERDDWQSASRLWERALKLTEINYRNAAEQAELKQQANIAAVKAQQGRINERAEDELEDSRRDADARYKRLLATKAATDPRGTGSAEMSAFAESTCIAVAGTGCDGIPPLLKAAQDNTDQLLALQQWAREQGEVQTSPDAEKGENDP